MYYVDDDWSISFNKNMNMFMTPEFMVLSTQIGMNELNR